MRIYLIRYKYIWKTIILLGRFFNKGI